IDSTLIILGRQLQGEPQQHPIEVLKRYGTLPLVECFVGPLNQVFMNILSNAIDALREAENQVSESLKKRHSQIVIQTSVEAENAVVSIQDNGLGMAEDVRNCMFDAFFTTKPVGKGTGMGMSISYQIVTERHQGQLLCESELGKGTRFKIVLPLSQ
ncbi:MAG: ATP-binding protein, partial [Cyanobacteria bacterium J06632_3]